MKKVLVSTMMLAGVLAVGSCNSGDSTSSTTKDSVSTADNNPVMAPAADTTTLASKPAPAEAKMTDADFVMKASGANIAEVNAHKAAQTHATGEVKMHAKMMLTDHTKLGSNMKALAAKKNWTLATDAPADKKQMLDDMNANKKGKDWDAAYLDSQENEHKDAIALFEKGQNDVQDSDLKDLITKTLPTLKNHLQMVQDAKAKMK